MSDSDLVSTGSLKSSSLPELIEELKSRKIGLIFIDDFYISRLKVKDPNSFSRKAPLMKEMRDNASSMPSMKLIKTFITGDNTKSYLYSFSGERKDKFRPGRGNRTSQAIRSYRITAASAMFLSGKIFREVPLFI
jgi:hypothetical protein